jgi:uncharacterized membrane protein YeaQ/YmgE (transglycosylase-associated protein family)
MSTISTERDKPLRLFVATCILGGLGGFIGSVVGGAFGQRALFIGGFIGGILISPISARIAVWRRWIRPDQFWWAVVGAALGFVAAASVAVNTLSSPVGPVLSLALTGAGAVLGSRRFLLA